MSTKTLGSALAAGAVLTSLAALAHAQVPSFPRNEVVGVVGASFGSCQAPVDSPLGGVGLAGCSYEGVYEALIKDKKIVQKDIRVENASQGGAFSYDVPGTGWRGLTTQVTDLMVRTSWFDGQQRLKHVVFTLTNDCLHSIPCTQADIDNVLIANTRAAILAAQAQGIQVYVVGYPRWCDLNLAQAAAIYGLTNVIDENAYNALTLRFRNAISTMPGVVYVDAWRNNFDPFDGLHPSQNNVRKAAKILGQHIAH